MTSETGKKSQIGLIVLYRKNQESAQAQGGLGSALFPFKTVEGTIGHS